MESNSDVNFVKMPFYQHNFFMLVIFFYFCSVLRYYYLLGLTNVFFDKEGYNIRYRP